MMTYSVPAKPYSVTGVFQAGGYDNPDAPLQGMREYAATLGLDGVALIRCNLGKISIPPARGAGENTETIIASNRRGDCAGQGFVWVNR
jgi:hypothetical protein